MILFKKWNIWLKLWLITITRLVFPVICMEPDDPVKEIFPNVRHRGSLPNIDIPTLLLRTSNTENSKAYSKVIELISLLLRISLKIYLFANF